MSYRIYEIRPFSGWRVDVYADEGIFSVFVDGEAVQWGWNCRKGIVPEFADFRSRTSHTLLIQERLELFRSILNSNVWKAWVVFSGHSVVKRVHEMMKSFLETHGQREAIWKRRLGGIR